MLLKQAQKIVNDPVLVEECKKGRQEKYIVSFSFQNDLKKIMHTDIVTCCPAAAHSIAFSTLLQKVEKVCSLPITAIVIHRNGVICEGE